MLRQRTSRESDPLPRPYLDYRIDWSRPSDLPRIARLEASLFPEPLRLGALARLWLAPRTCYLVARKGRLLAAYIGFQLFGPAAHTISMAVHPDHRRRGLATVIQRTADQVAANRGARWFTGEVRVSNQAQLRLLERLGWQRIGVCPRFFGNGEAAVVVWYWL